MAKKFYGGDEEVLQLDARRILFDAVRRFAGAHFRELERQTKMPSGSLRYHLAYLVRHGLLREEREGNSLRYFPSFLDTRDDVLISFLRQESIRRILLHIIVHRGCNQESITQFVGLSSSTVSYHLKKLEENKIISSTRRGRERSYQSLEDERRMIALLIAYRESFFDTLVDRVTQTWK